mgnify:CR=1 FL=1
MEAVSTWSSRLLDATHRPACENGMVNAVLRPAMEEGIRRRVNLIGPLTSSRRDPTLYESAPRITYDAYP